MRLVWALLFVVLTGAVECAHAQFKESPAEPEKSSRLGSPVTQRLKVGVIITAGARAYQNILATMPVPDDWPEQTVKIVDEAFSPTVQSVQYRSSAGQLKQMVVEVPTLEQGDVAKVIVTFEVTRAPQLPPDDTTLFKVPKKLDRQLLLYTSPSPMIETRHAKIVALAKELVANKETAWDQVRSLYDWVQDNVKVKAGDLKGAVKTLNDKTGDSEDLTSLFVALCRAVKVPARTVWVTGHCYPEFYLLDEAGQGCWFPCQVAGAHSFGRIGETRPILFKGDNFTDPDRPRERFRFVTEFAKWTESKDQPHIRWVRETSGL